MTIRLGYTHLARLPRSFTQSSFRNDFFARDLPVVFPQDHFIALPCITKWFTEQNNIAQSNNARSENGSSSMPGERRLNTDYLSQFSDASVEIEATQVADNGVTKQFTRHSAPFDLFLKWSQSQLSQSVTATQVITGAREDVGDVLKLYIAQSSLDNLPLDLQGDVPTPELVQNVGKGDVYGSSLWMGIGATNTPLHRDPNPNLFVQLAGRKRIRVMKPLVGDAVYASLRATNSAGIAGGRVRGEEMMMGTEADVLHRLIWEDASLDLERSYDDSLMYETMVESGDAVFVPKGWWHAIRGEGRGINASVNWWFR